MFFRATPDTATKPLTVTLRSKTPADQSILAAYENELISEETAKLFASRKGRISRGIDLIQKARGVDTELDSGLRLDLPANAFR